MSLPASLMPCTVWLRRSGSWYSWVSSMPSVAAGSSSWRSPLMSPSCTFRSRVDSCSSWLAQASTCCWTAVLVGSWKVTLLARSTIR